MEDLTKWQQAETVWLINKKPEAAECTRGSNGSLSKWDKAASRPHAALNPGLDNPGPGLQRFSLPTGTREARPRFAFPQRTGEIRVVPRLMRRFGRVSNHNGENSSL